MKGKMYMSGSKHEKERANFSGKLGYVLATAGASVGLGNIWRFPYLAAKYGGGIFILIYLILTVTFGYTMALSETAVGRMTKKSPVGAFTSFGKTGLLKFGGWLNAIIPMIIVPYYAVIGGWVIKYLVEYLKGNGMALAEDTYFNSFITDQAQPEFFFVIFAVIVFAIILCGVENGIERSSKIMMPLLIVLAVCVTIYSVTRPGAIEGVKYLLIPDFSNFSVMTIVAAMGQMFYSLSIAMGILYTYGSYLKPEVDADQSTRQIEFFDAGIALMAGLMIVPAVFAFSGGDPAMLQAGSSLMFITLPKVFASTSMANLIGAVFFFLVFFAALTSAIALMESCISTFEDELHWKRPACCILMAIILMVIGTLSATGYGPLSGVTVIGMAFLDFFDFLSNSIMMPIAAIATCLLILYKIGLNKVVEEIERSSPFKRKKVYVFFLKYLAIICVGLIFLSCIIMVNYLSEDNEKNRIDWIEKMEISETTLQHLRKEIPALTAQIRALYQRLDRITGLSGADIPIRFSFDRDVLGAYTRKGNGEYEHFLFSLLFVGHGMQKPLTKEEREDLYKHEYAHYMQYNMDIPKRYNFESGKHGSAWRYCCSIVGAAPTPYYKAGEALMQHDYRKALYRPIHDKTLPVRDQYRQEKAYKTQKESIVRFKIGDKVTHPKYGEGIIESIEQVTGNVRLKIRFGAELKVIGQSWLLNTQYKSMKERI